MNFACILHGGPCARVRTLSASYVVVSDTSRLFGVQYVRGKGGGERDREFSGTMLVDRTRGEAEAGVSRVSRRIRSVRISIDAVGIHPKFVTSE